MTLSSHRTPRGSLRGLFRAFLLGGVAAAASWSIAAAQPGVTPQAQNRTITIGPAQGQPLAQPAAPQKLNPTGRTVTLTVPAKDGALYLGDVVLTISPDDKVEFSSARILDLLSSIITPTTLETMRSALAGKQTVTPQDFMPAGLVVTYNPQTLELVLDIPSQLRAAQGLSVASLDHTRFGDYAKPAGFSSYLNIRGNIDYSHTGTDVGFGDPVLFLDANTRVDNLVLQTQGIWTPGAANDFQRQGSRAVYDDTGSITRWTLGDLETVSRGFQSAPGILGVSVLRSYSALQPQTIARPRGDRSFSLDRPSTVEVYINGQLLRRLQLQPGNYNLSDFPFTQGANDVRMQITDDTGRTQVLRFNLFVDQTQLGKGLSEFGFYAGTKSTLGADGPEYSNDWTVSGFYRRGVTDSLTLGVNYQAEQGSQLGGAEAVASTALGTLGVQAAVSKIAGYATGTALTLTLQRQIEWGGGKADSLNLSYQTRSRTFGSVGTVTPSNPYEYELGAGYTHSWGDDVYSGIDLHYSKGRDGAADVSNYRATVGWRLSSSTSLTADALYEDGQSGHDVAALLSLTTRLGAYSSAKADYDTRDNRAQVSYQTLHGQGVGSYTAAFDVDHSDTNSGVNGVVNYVGDRGEVGLSHLGVFDNNFSNTLDERTSFRFGTSFAVADGAVAMGRPIFDSFAIVKPYKTLGNANILLDPTPSGYIADTGVMHSAIMPSLPSYSEQTITVDAPNAPPGADLGQGSFRVFPPYRSGYRLEVGSEYFVTAIGVLLTVDGTPLALTSGTATEDADPNHPVITVFTNRDGRFGLAGLRPGRWTIHMLGDEPATYVIDVPQNAQFVLRLDSIKPVEGK